MDTVRSFAATLLAPLRHLGTDVAEDIAERAVILALASVAAGFALAGATVWLALRHGLLTACLVMAGIFAALAIVALLARVARRRARLRRRRIETERARAAVSTVTQAATVAADIGAALRGATGGEGLTGLAAGAVRDAARQVNPWALILGALAAGYAGARGIRR